MVISIIVALYIFLSLLSAIVFYSACVVSARSDALNEIPVAHNDHREP